MQASSSKMEKEEGSGGTLDGIRCSYGCEEDDNAVIRWCIPCKRGMCGFCAMMHGRQARTKTHKLIGTEACGNTCQGDDAGCTHVCVDCDMAICWLCEKLHKRRAEMKSHQLCSIAP